MARAIAMLHTAEKLQSNVYNIGSGRTTPNREIVESIKKAVPGFDVTLQPGPIPFPSLPVMDIKRLQADTGFTPKHDTRSAIQEYVD